MHQPSTAGDGKAQDGSNGLLKTVHHDRISSLCLPHMPHPSSSAQPTIRILVCADVDLQSTSDLCEYSLQQRGRIFDPSTIDMVLVCGPLTSDLDMEPFWQGQNKQRERNAEYPPCFAPFLESPEITAARQGIVTACLSQLENIVCRVVYLVGATDPRLQSNTMRLTPNSRNISQQWLSIAPGLGCAGLCHLDGIHALLDELGDQANTTEEDGAKLLDDSESTRSTEAILIDRMKVLAERTYGYSETVEELLLLGDRHPAHTCSEGTSSHGSAQTILVTQYVDINKHSLDNTSDMETQRNAQSAFHEFHKEKVCLEVASGDLCDEAKWITPQLLYPGSLRQRGEFVLLDIALLPEGELEHQQWKCQSSSFHTLNDFG